MASSPLSTSQVGTLNSTRLSLSLPCSGCSCTCPPIRDEICGHVTASPPIRAHLLGDGPHLVMVEPLHRHPPLADTLPTTLSVTILNYSSTMHSHAIMAIGLQTHRRMRVRMLRNGKKITSRRTIYITIILVTLNLCFNFFYFLNQNTGLSYKLQYTW